MKHADDVRGRALDLAALTTPGSDRYRRAGRLGSAVGPDTMMSDWAKNQFGWRR
jgi:hypothetical protein